MAHVRQLRLDSGLDLQVNVFKLSPLGSEAGGEADGGEARRIDPPSLLFFITLEYPTVE